MGRFDEAGPHLDKAEGLVREIGEKRMAVQASMLRATIMTRQGLVNMAIDQMHRAVEAAEQLGDADLLLQSKVHLGTVLIENAAHENDKLEARRILESALLQAQKYELAPVVEKVEEAIAKFD
jgi:hypothetical protein